AGLHPAWVAIYQRYGYGSVSLRHTYRVEPRDIRFHHPVALPGRVREIDPAAEFGVLVDIYRRYREDRTALVHRGRAMWQAGALQEPPQGHQQVVLVYEEAGLAFGHVVFSHGREPDGARRLRVTDFFALTPAAHQALWAVLGGYDNVDEVVWDNAPPDDPLPLMLAEPRRLNQSVRDGIMIRLVSVAAALAQRPYAVATELRFGLRDEFCPWNNGSWRLATSPEGGLATRIDGQSVDFTLTPDTLAALVFGRDSASAANRAGLLGEHPSPDALLRWDEALRLAHPPHEAEHTW
ncbi:MAG: sterol carrier protein domain-containing protein, partial [Alphaproteobacteria bacterium]|nr:sterol carrier protein domain-containing protein [Alphaproteobacteria bacterium]